MRLLDLLPLVTTFKRGKIVRQKQAMFTALTGPWSALSHLVRGYEIHNGRTLQSSSGSPARLVMGGTWLGKIKRESNGVTGT